MANRNFLAVIARVLGIDPANYPNDSKLEQKILWNAKRATTFAGTLATQTLTGSDVFSDTETITIGAVTYTMKTALSEVKASSTLTSDTTAPDDGDMVVVRGQTYTFRTALTNTVGAPYEVLIGVSAATALDNLKSAINGTTGAGTTYGAGTNAHPDVTAEANTDTTQEVTAKNFGTYANGYRTSETSAHLAWDDTTLGGASATPGVNAVANEVLIDADLATSLDNLKLAINYTVPATNEGVKYSTGTRAHPQVTATTNTNTAQTVQAIDYSVTNASIATTETAANASWGAATLASGVAKVVALDGTTVNGSAGLSGDANV